MCHAYSTKAKNHSFDLIESARLTLTSTKANGPRTQAHLCPAFAKQEEKRHTFGRTVGCVESFLADTAGHAFLE
jgi:hypothetical protein